MSIFKRKDEEPKETNEPKIEIDPLAAAREAIDKLLATENLYFELVAKVSDGNKKLDAISKNMMKMSIVDQLRILKIMVALVDLAPELLEKYGIDLEEEV